MTEVSLSAYSGLLGDWYSHAAKECSTGTALSITITPEPGDRYFLIVPVFWSEEGTYGADSSGNPRPLSLPSQAPPPHCP